MNIYALFSETGFVRGFYHVEDGMEPDGSVLISEDQWKDLVVNQSYRRWDGEKIVDYIHPVIKPQINSVSAAQAQTALFNAGLLDEVEGIVATHPYRPVKIFYERANTWDFTNPYVQAIAVELGLITVDAQGNHDSSALQSLFEAANRI